MSVMPRRVLVCQDQDTLRAYPMFRGFYAKQRPKVKQPMPPRAKGTR